MPSTDLENSSDRKAYIITGPTSGIGRRAAFELAAHGTVVLVGRDRQKLDELQKAIEQKGQHAVSVVCELSDPASGHTRRRKSSRSIFRSPACSTTRASAARCVPPRTRWAGT